MKFQAIKDLESHLATEFGAGSLDVAADLCPPEFAGDITVNCFVLAKQLRRAPPQIAAKAVAFLSGHADVAAAECLKAFVNVTFKPAALFRDTVADLGALLEDARFPAAQRQRVLIEYSAPNTNKPQHLGHVRNNTLGMATAAVLREAGHAVVPVNLINDRGIHICKSMLAYQRWGNGETPESVGKKGDHFVGDYYVKFDAEFRKQLAALRTAQPELKDKADEDLFLETEIGRAAQDMLVAWENHDPTVHNLWQTMNGWVLAGFEQTYARMGVRFDKVYLESNTYQLGKDIIRDGLARGVFQKRDDGAVFIDLEDKGLGTKVVLRSDGTSVYITQDIGTTLLKQNEHQPDRQIWVVGDEQKHHFQVLFAILQKLGYPWASELTHMAYGMVNLPSGRMKSREGTVVDADNLFDEMRDLARQETLTRAGADVPADLDERAQVIAMAATKFMLLKVNPRTTILFDPQASVTFEGDTGPYVLYAYARISSMLRKADAGALAGAVDWSVLGVPEEKDLALRCSQYGTVVRKAAVDLDTSCLSSYLLDLAKSFSRFYRACSVLGAPTPELRRARLELSAVTRTVLKAGLSALTVGTLESM
ncbi:MAG: arginine--tRNA ligase [Lentisphaerae bacterium RIFOXYB12_FULL_65_16]|nr:MAG: arginine--tRNA ligase [Lentisphaerae bacterium RIFOXYA12_64_32]OGV88790.1 MAG: arginine--tRNA ligase [Lentisphaerae bacterium RIFOXYB12_FULL_65_16]